MTNSGDAEQKAALKLETGSYRDAVKILQPLAELDSHYALLSLGWVYETGVIEKADMRVAQSFYERATIAGSVPAYFELGRVLLRQNKENEARRVFDAGAKLGNIACMARLGRMMVEGRGGSKDMVAGSTLLRNAAAQGHILAERTLLGIEYREAGSIFKKLLVKMKIMSLAKKGAKDILENHNTDNIR